MKLAEVADLASSTAASLARLGSGRRVSHLGARPARRLELYERESCPFSRKVREALSVLDLDAIVHPCPEGGVRFRPKVEERHGWFTIPYLIDPNTHTELADSDTIVRYLFAHYGDGQVPLRLRLRPVTDVTSKLASRLRRDHGERAKASREPDALLELWSYEGSPRARLVREVLGELEIPYVLHNAAPGSAKTSPDGEIPFIADPRHGLEIAGVHEIVAHLRERYGTEARRAAA